MIFQYTSCPVCGSTYIYKDQNGYEQCHDCINPFTHSVIPVSTFEPLNQGHEQVIKSVHRHA